MARSRRCSRCVLIPSCLAARCELHEEALSKLEFFGVIDFFLSETAHHADVVFAGSLQEEDEGVDLFSAEGRVQKINKAADPPGDAKSDALIICDLAQKLGRGQYFEFGSTREIYEELRVASRGGIADYYGITWERIEQELGVFWPCPSARSSRNSAAF